uniref:Uncharacterized protein n=1 Tax=Myotis myotis TaxID=51298 RepID=A0A7J7WI03_MYOMY|nr:hypothetical protein mMyoMyo1_012190 [Myotis myotis]
MELGQLTQAPLANVFINAMIGLLHVDAYKMEGIGSGQQWEEFLLLGLKIQNLWFWFTRLDFRQVPHGAVSDGNGARLRQAPSSFSREEGPDGHHRPVGPLVTHGFHMGATRLHLGVHRQHVFSGDTIMVPLQVAIIHLIIADLGPMSPTVIPGKGLWVPISRIGTMKACNP